MNDLAPIVLFTYNRPIHTRKTLEALSKNDLALSSKLFIYSDGPKDPLNLHLITEIQSVREIIREQKWCGSVTIVESEVNKGLATSIISAVTEIVSKYGKIIVLEDDIICSKGFLKFMNDALCYYEDNNRVMHISGYMYPHNIKLPETFFFDVPYPGGGWATWSRAWTKFEPNTLKLYNYFEDNNLWRKFNKLGGTYLQDQLIGNVTNRLNTWFIKWHATLLLNDGLTLYPNQSLTNNIGFDDSGTHCATTSRFNVDQLLDTITVEKTKIKVNKSARRLIVKFYQGNYYLRFKIYIYSKLPKSLIRFIKKLC